MRMTCCRPTRRAASTTTWNIALPRPCSCHASATTGANVAEVAPARGRSTWRYRIASLSLYADSNAPWARIA